MSFFEYDEKMVSENPIKMEKGDMILLRGLKNVKVGFGWKGVDNTIVDTYVVPLKWNSKFGEIVSDSNTSNKNKSIVHDYEKLGGPKTGDEDAIGVDLDRIPKEICVLVFMVVVFNHEITFNNVTNLYCRLLKTLDETRCKPICQYNYPDQTKSRCKQMLMCTLSREGRLDWVMKVFAKEMLTHACRPRSGRDMLNMMELTRGIIKSSGINVKKEIEEDNKIQDRLTIELELCPARIEIPGKLTIKCSAEKVDKMDFLGKSDPYFIIYNTSTGEEESRKQKIYSSEILKNTLNPDWKEGVVEGIDKEATHTVHIFDWNKISSDDFIGSFEFIPSEVESICRTEKVAKFEIINEKKKAKKKKYINSGVFVFEKVKTVSVENKEYSIKLKEVDEIRRSLAKWENVSFV